MHVYLKIKIKSLAAEAQIIRRETKRYRGDHPARIGLYLHRIHIVRREARAACLAYGFLRGRAYAALEKSPREAPDWKRVEQLVTRYGVDDLRDRMQRFSEWRDTTK